MTDLQILTLLAVLPGIIILLYVNRLDRVEKEPVSLLLKLLLFGAVSTIPAALLELVGEVLLSAFLGESMLSSFLLYFAVVGGAEEFCKRFFLKRLTWNHPAFNYRFDGIVYAVSVSLGFAILENVRYVLQNGLTVALLRALTAVPAHAIFGIFMGYYYGQAKYMENMGDLHGSRRYLKHSLLVPILLHGLYDFSAVGGFNSAGTIFLVFLLVLDITALIKLKKASRSDHRIDPDLPFDE